MTTPSVDIIVPVWNNPFETRACLAAILTHSPEARLILIDNGSSRETELMLEEFSESLGERGLFMNAERNIGLVPAINRGLARSDSDFAIVLRPQITVCSNWLNELLNAALRPGIGIVTPTFRGSGAPKTSRPIRGCTQMETFSLSFATLLLKGEMHRAIGGFDEDMDGGEWCLKDYIRRAEATGHHSCVTVRPELICEPETVFGSPERRQKQSRQSRELYLTRWSAAQHYCLYFGTEVQADDLSDAVEKIMAGARHGHRYTLLLHRRQFKEFRKRGWNGLHTGISISSLPMFGAKRSLTRQIDSLRSADPDMIPVCGVAGVPFPGSDLALPFDEISVSGTIKNLGHSLEVV